MCGFQGLPVPERSRRDWLFAAALFATAIVWHLPQFSFVQMNPDEGIVLQGAHRILHGAVLYRDFFSFYTPGSYYWTAVLFRMLGESILTARMALLLYAGLTAALAYLLARRLCSRTASVVVSIALIMAWSFRFLALHNWDSTMLSLAALYAAVWLLQAQRGYWAAVTGLLAGLTLLTEQSKGAGLLLGLAIALLLIPRLTGSSLRRLHVLMLIAGFLAPVLPTFAYSAAKRTSGTTNPSSGPELSSTTALPGHAWPSGADEESRPDARCP
jgi:4-amino-4-deoxy-L-arabinose transferase-like glycosyltransferase